MCHDKYWDSGNGSSGVASKYGEWIIPSAFVFFRCSRGAVDGG